MRLLSFRVQHFRNLTAPIELAELGAFNLLHGDNNVGKSNLLQAMELFLKLLAFLPPNAEPNRVEGSWLAPHFNLARPFAIELAAELSTSEAELATGGIAAPALEDVSKINVALRLERTGPTWADLQVKHLRFGRGGELTPVPPLFQYRNQLASFLSTRALGGGRLVEAARSQLTSTVDALYDAHVSPDRVEAERWTRFEEGMATFREVLGEGRFVPVLPRGAQSAELYFETATMRVPVRSLGTGVQQVIAVLGTLLTSGASVVFLEEPEAHLRWTRQRQLREALASLVGKPGAPEQLFVTSHSGAFETEETFFAMTRGPEGPIVQRRPAREAVRIVGTADDVPQPLRSAKVPTYLTSEGVLQLPRDIRAAIGLEHGGGVAFIDKKDKTVELMADDTFFERAGVGVPGDRDEPGG